MHTTLKHIACAGALVLLASPASAQLGRQRGLVEPNIAADSTLLKLPYMNAAIVQAHQGCATNPERRHAR